MGGSSSDHVSLISALSRWPLIKQLQWVDKDELGVSVAPSPEHSCPGASLTIKSIFVLTCQWPAPLHPVASKGMVNQAFHVLRHVGLYRAFLTPTPPASPKAPSSVVPVESRAEPPAAVSSPCPGFSERPPMLWLAGPHRNKPNKLMSQMWVYSEHTVQPGDLMLLPIPRSLIQLIRGVESHLA